MLVLCAESCYTAPGKAGRNGLPVFFCALFRAPPGDGKERMYSKIYSMTLLGMEGVPIRVECDTSSGLPETSLVGFLGAEVKEAQARVRTAMKNTGFQLPPRRITVNLSPADIRKEGTSFDLAVASALPDQGKTAGGGRQR